MVIFFYNTSTTFLQGSVHLVGVVGYYTNVSAEVQFISGFVMIKGIGRVSGEGEGQSQ